MSSTAKELRPPSVLGEVGLARVGAIAVIMVLALALQTTLLKTLTILGVKPQLVLVVVICLALLDGSRVGVVAGFTGGLLLDLQYPPQAILGLSAFVYIFVGYTVGVLREMAPSGSVWVPVLAVAGASAVAEVSYALLSVILGQTWVGVALTLKIVGLVILYNTLLTPFTFPLVRRVADRFRLERIYR